MNDLHPPIFKCMNHFQSSLTIKLIALPFAIKRRCVNAKHLSRFIERICSCHDTTDMLALELLDADTTADHQLRILSSASARCMGRIR